MHECVYIYIYNTYIYIIHVRERERDRFICTHVRRLTCSFVSRHAKHAFSIYDPFAAQSAAAHAPTPKAVTAVYPLGGLLYPVEVVSPKKSYLLFIAPKQSTPTGGSLSCGCICFTLLLLDHVFRFLVLVLFKCLKWGAKETAVFVLQACKPIPWDL